ncbi:hypothetical protein FB565_003354 [Actinoplanes lutulentus]|uniref:SPFH domain/Band 7 family protein n=1 Tax=Actinoplanes lutulentus TaxID=1287878 RepID=A0A327Z044_9ACTN|nr:hypothetical protein [Actinoplanes lutulentus]MBB2943625.1 hypothetical protein [Actinoplanes lutulentus]RAK27490.1 hypothetical protein B0I29_123124 [Actinoplanes lutulentus]
MNGQPSFDPIIRETLTPVLSFGTEPTSRGNVVIVYRCAGNETPRRSVPSFGTRLRTAIWQYEVDSANHPIPMTLRLPAKEEAFFFTVMVALVWAVSDAVELVRSGVRDVKPIIWGTLDPVLRAVSRQHSIEDSGQAEADMVKALEKETGDIKYGLRMVFLSVNVRPDSAAERYLAEREGSRRAGELARDEHRLQMLREGHVHELNELSGRLERARADHEIALKSQRADFYRTALRGDNYDFVVLQLIEHPEDITGVVEMLNSGKERFFDKARMVITDLLKGNLVNAADMDPLREDAINQLRTALDIASPQRRVMIERERQSLIEKERIIKDV